MSDLKLEVQQRDATGKNVNRRLRAEGRVPAVVYGGGVEPAAISVERRKVEEILRSSSGENALFLLQMAGTDQSRHAMIRELQTNAATDEMLHLDFQRVLLDQAIRVDVPIDLQGEAVGVKTEGGLIDFITREVTVECLPGDIPDVIVLDVSELHIGQHIEAGQLELPEGVTLVEDTDRVILSLSLHKVEEEEVEEEDEEGLITETAEPEVIGQEEG